MARERNRPLGLLTGKDDYLLFKMMMMMMIKKHKEIIALVKIVTNTNKLWKNEGFLELQSSVNIVTTWVYRFNAKLIKCPVTFMQSS
jgi:hypothetical protein